MTHSAIARAIRYINFLIAVALAAALAAVYWYAWRPLAVRSGTVAADVSAPATAVRDRQGTPHIRAATLEDALFVQGYVTAQDRLWQMDAMRRMAAGELAEVVGPQALNSDRDTRRLRTRRIAENWYPALPAADRAGLAAYTRGVNAFISTHLSSLPVEFTLLGYQPRPWSVVDSLLVMLQMFRDLSNTWRTELIKRAMLAAGDRAKVETLYPLGTGEAPPAGSNAWVIAGNRTASGKPLLSNDPHLRLTLPDIWYMAHLEAGGMNVSGATIPGLPGVIIGHNERIAWGVTNLGFDVQDLYLAKFDPATGQYQIRGKPERAALEHELIQVKGQPTVDLPIWETRFGPLFVTEGNDQMILRWVVTEPGFAEYPFLDLDRARNWQEFQGALARYPGPGQNFVYADVDGNIGYHAAGKLPVRRGYAGDLPVDVSEGDFDWDGLIPFDQLPSAWNPPGGMIVTANQNPFPAGYPYPVNGAFATSHRARQIAARIRSRGKWQAADMLSVEMDVYSAFDQFLARQIVAACEKKPRANATIDTALTLLRGWNGQMDQGLAAPFLATLAFEHVRSAIAESAAPSKPVAYEAGQAPAVIEDLLRRRPAGWFPGWDEMLARTFADAVEEGVRIQGRDPARWKYGRSRMYGAENMVVHAVPLVGPYFDLRPLPMSGGRTTVKQVSQQVSPSMRMNVDLNDWDRSLLNGRVGQSGQILSSHYRDEWQAWYYGTSYPMQFQRVEAEDTLTFQPR